MGKKLDEVYQALLDGASAGLVDKALYEYISKKCPKTSSKRIVKASLLALTDPHVKNREILNVIYALAIKYRLVSLGVEDDLFDDEDDRSNAPLVTEATRHRLQASTAAGRADPPVS
jgi:hypothetical protein